MDKLLVEPVRKSIEVGCDPQRAFAIFTAQFAEWWPADNHSVSAMNGNLPGKVILEPRLGGEVYEIMPDGKREEWAIISRFEPGRRLVLEWFVMNPRDKATHVEISFTPTAKGTRVDLVHSGWEVHGEQAAARRNNYDGGWVGVFEKAFAGACAAA